MKKQITIKPTKEIEFLVNKIAQSQALFGGEFLQWVMDNIEWLMKEYDKHYIRRKS